MLVGFGKDIQNEKFENDDTWEIKLKWWSLGLANQSSEKL